MNSAQQRSMAVVLFATAVLILGLAAFYGLRINQLFMGPKERFSRAFEDDLALLKKTSKIPKEWENIKSIQIRPSGNLAQQLTSDWKPTFKQIPNGKYQLDIFVTEAIDVTARSYSVVVEFSTIEIGNQNTVNQFGRTLPVGYLF